ncbi:MAG: hypothetical protein LBB61_09340 [Treponema sp.]|nr:hypothetical protein [Treponema sp.]
MDVCFASLLDRAAGDNAAGITVEDDFEHQSGGIGGSAAAVVVEGGDARSIRSIR